MKTRLVVIALATMAFAGHALAEKPVVKPYAAQFVDATPDRSPDLMRVLGEGDSEGLGSDNGSGEEAPSIAA